MSVLFRGASVVDGTEEPRYTADVLVSGGRIETISTTPGELSPGDARVIDADGLALSPGFIDMHAHSDIQILLNPDHMARINQGVTTEVCGQDGLSYAPTTDETLTEIRHKIAGWNTDPGPEFFTWRSVAGYLDRLDEGVATNVVYLVPQGTLRAYVAGFDDRPATADEIARMQDVLRQSMTEGAAGMSAGLTYTPGMYADDDELTDLLRVVHEMGGYFSPHHRSYGKGALEAYEEMIDISKAAGSSLHLTHACMNFRPNAGRGTELVALVDAAAAGGLDVTLDTYPYLPGATTLAAELPSWSSAGGNEATLARLADPETLARIREDLEVNGSDGCHGVTAEWETIEISGVRHAELDGYVGRTIDQIARDESRPPFEVYVDILRRDKLGTGILQHVGHEENVRAIMQSPYHTAGSDGLLVGAKPHPRAWATFTRYLAVYCRELGLFSLEECVGHLVGRAAKRLKLVDRGFVKEGYAADLVLFDPDRVADLATFAEPRVASAGIHHVLVNGEFALDDGHRTDSLAGHSLRRGADGRVG